jgi:tetratricopeptide (TPR) repeat protein
VIEKEAPATFSLAESISDGSKAIRACIDALWAITGQNPALFGSTTQAIEWVNRVDRYAKPGTTERATADMWLGCIKYTTGDIQAALQLFHQALDLSRRLGAQDNYIEATCWLLLTGRAPHRTGERRQLAEEIWAIIRGKASVRLPALPWWIGNTFFVLGERRRAEEAWSELKALAERSGLFLIEVMSLYDDAILLCIDGRFEDALDIIDRTRARGEAIGMSGFTEVFTSSAEYRPRIYMGRSVEGLEHDIRGNPYRMPEFCLVLSHLGKNEEASEIIEKYVVKRPDVGTVEDETASSADAMFLEAAVILGQRQAARLLLDRFSGTTICSTEFYATCIPRHLGGAAALLERYDEARKYYQEAIKVCTEMKFRPELALSRLQLAELLLEHYPEEKREALEHLDFAIKEFREMKMQPSLERALSHKDILKA